MELVVHKIVLRVKDFTIPQTGVSSTIDEFELKLSREGS
jgi:hypothetical protein